MRLSTTSSPTAPPQPRARRARLAPLAIVVTGALVLAGCGGDDDEQEPPATPQAAASFNVTSELASSVPGDAQAFAEIKIKPEGEQKAAIDEIAKLLGAEGSIADELGLNDDDGDLSFSEDVEPNIGDRIAGFALVAENAGANRSGGDDGIDGAFVVPVTDQAKLTSSLEGSFDKDTKKVQVAGQDAFRNEDGMTLWVGESVAAIGTEKAVAAAIEAQGGETLDKNERFVNALKQVRGSDPLAVGWSDFQNAEAMFSALATLGNEGGDDALKELQRSGVPGADASQLDALKGLSETPVPDIDATIAMAVQMKPGEMKIEIGGTQPAPSGGSLEELTKAGADAVAALPSGSWLAAGGSMEAASGLPGYSLPDQLKQIEQATGEKLPAVLTSSLEKIKTVAVGVKGDSLMSIGGAAIAQTDDAAASGELLKTLETELAKDRTLKIDKTPVEGADDAFVVSTPQVPIRVAVGYKGDRLVIGLGAEAVTNALEGARPLSGDDAYKQAQEALGGDAPSMFVNPAPVAQLLGDLPPGSGNVGEVVDALSAVKLIAASSVATGDTTYRGTFVLRYDAAALGRAVQGGSGSGSGTVTAPQPGR